MVGFMNEHQTYYTYRHIKRGYFSKQRKVKEKMYINEFLRFLPALT